MRKDTIEERIVGIERGMKELRSEIRQEITSMASDIRESQAAMIVDMMGEIQDAMSSGYRQIAYEISIGGAEKRFKEEMCPDCPPAERDPCIAHYVEEHLRKGIESVDGASPEARETALAVIIDHDADNSRQYKGTACEYCQGIYIAERDRLLGMERKFTAYRNDMSAKRSLPYFKQLPDDLTVSELIDPLSHRARFVMLKNLTLGCMSFKDLGEVTGYGGGHLIYHLNRLVSAGLVSKADSGLYQITGKGMDVMEVVRRMHGR